VNIVSISCIGLLHKSEIGCRDTIGYNSFMAIVLSSSALEASHKSPLNLTSLDLVSGEAQLNSARTTDTGERGGESPMIKTEAG